jgi:hypothetical protein
MTTAPVSAGPASSALRIVRPLAFILLGLGVLGSIAAAIWILDTRSTIPTEDELRAMSRFTTGLLIFAHSAVGAVAGPALIGAALAGAGLFWLARTRRWPFAAIAIAAVVMLAGVWMMQTLVEEAEDPRYRKRSAYVKGATRVAYAGTLYFVALAGTAGAAWFLSRPRRSGLPAEAAPGTMKSGGAV